MTTNEEVEMFERIGKIVEQKEVLAKALESLIPRFERAAKVLGSDDEFIAECTKPYRDALEFARQP